MSSPCVEFILKSANVLPFNGPRNFLAMISKSQFWLDGVWFTSVEHYYQFTKIKELLSEKQGKSLRMEKLEPSDMRRRTKSFLKKHGVMQTTVNEWKNRRAPAVLYDGIKAKFDQNGTLRSQLLETGSKVLVNTFKSDNVFTTGSTKEEFMRWASSQNAVIKMPENLQCYRSCDFPIIHKGHNVLGFLLMELRQLYLKAVTSVPPSLRPPGMPAESSFNPFVQSSYHVSQQDQHASYYQPFQRSYVYGHTSSQLNSTVFNHPPPMLQESQNSYSIRYSRGYSNDALHRTY